MTNEESGVDIGVLASGVLDSVLVMVEKMVEAAGVDICCDSDGKAIEITKDDSVYLVSWHEPSAQIWVASPCSGSVRFSYNQDSNLWYNLRDGCELMTFVRKEIEDIFGITGE